MIQFANTILWIMFGFGIGSWALAMVRGHYQDANLMLFLAVASLIGALL